MNASLAFDKISITHTVCDNREFLIFSVPNGWDDVKKLTNKVLTFDGRDFTFSGWNSDTLKCYFARGINEISRVATIR